MVGGLTTDPSVTLQVDSGSLSFTAGSTSTFGGPVTIFGGASMSFGDGASVAVATELSVTGGGALTLGDEVQVSLITDNQSPTSIQVAGTLTATNSSFTATGSGSASIVLTNTGRLLASDCTFSLTRVVLGSNFMQSGDLINNIFANNTTVLVPSGWLGYLSDNTSFCDIAISDSTLRSGTLALDPIGTDTSNLRYVFPGGFTITKLATIDIAPDMTVVIPSGQTLTVDGTLNSSDGDRILLDPENQQSAQIVVTGTLNAQGTYLRLQRRRRLGPRGRRGRGPPGRQLRLRPERHHARLGCQRHADRRPARRRDQHDAA